MNIAIIGSGIAGLGAAYLLKNHHLVTLYEKNDYIGGHSRTVTIDMDQQSIPVDTGFIVFNYRNYPHLTGLFEQLNVPIAKSDMSFGVSIQQGWLEYGTRRLYDLIAQKSNLLRIDFYRMIRDIMHFNHHAKQFLDRDVTLGQCLKELGLGQWFRDYYLLAMGASIWSMPKQAMLDFPAASFIRFFDNHGLLTVSDQPQWYTVQGGSREYVQRLTQSFREAIHLNRGVERVKRLENGVEITDQQGKTQCYDQVIFACHSDQILPLLENPTEQVQQIIGAIRYQPNQMVLHTDTSFMPKRKRAWSSWVYLSEQQEDHQDRVSLSYWMNNLQPLATKTPIIVTINPGRMPDEQHIKDQFSFDHPVFDQAAIIAQEKMDSIQGKDRLWYAGAWQRYGFHEDGLWSAVRVAKSLGATIPWK